MALTDEIKLKSQLGFTDDKLEKIYSKYESGKLSPEQSSDFERDFPEYINTVKTSKEDYLANLNEGSAQFQTPKIGSYLSTVEPEKLSLFEEKYNSGKMDAQQRMDYEKDKKEFLSSSSGGADAKVRMAVGAETDPERRFAVVKKYHPEAVKYGDNFLIKKDGKTELFNPEGFDVKDIAGAAPEIVGALGGTVAALGTGGTAAAIGGSALADAGGKRLTQEAIRYLMGNNDIEGINEESVIDKAKEVGIDTGLGIAGGLLGHGISKVGGTVLDKLNKNILRPMNEEKAKIIVNQLDNASPEVKELLKENGLLLSTAYPGMAKVEGSIAKLPIVGGGIQEAQRTGGLLLTDSIENNALKQAGLTKADLSGTTLATKSSNIADDIKSIRDDNYATTLENILTNNSKDRVPLNNFYDSINTYVSKFEDVGMDGRKIKELKTLMGGFDFDANPTPTYESIEAITKSLRQKVNDTNLSGDKKAIAKDLLKSLEKDIMDVVPEDRLLRKDYAEKSGGLDILGFRGGRAGANLEQNLSVPEELVTSPSSFNTRYNQLLKGRGNVFNPQRTAESLTDTKELADVLARAGLYENTSNSGSTALVGNALMNLVTGKLGSGLLGAGAYGMYGGQNRSVGDVAVDAGKGLLGGLVFNKVTNGLLKNQAQNAIRRSANPNYKLKEYIQSAKGGLLNKMLISNTDELLEDK